MVAHGDRRVGETPEDHPLRFAETGGDPPGLASCVCVLASVVREVKRVVGKARVATLPLARFDDVYRHFQQSALLSPFGGLVAVVRTPLGQFVSGDVAVAIAVETSKVLC